MDNLLNHIDIRNIRVALKMPWAVRSRMFKNSVGRSAQYDGNNTLKSFVMVIYAATMNIRLAKRKVYDTSPIRKRNKNIFF